MAQTKPPRIHTHCWLRSHKQPVSQRVRVYPSSSCRWIDKDQNQRPPRIPAARMMRAGDVSIQSAHLSIQYPWCARSVDCVRIRFVLSPANPKTTEPCVCMCLCTFDRLVRRGPESIDALSQHSTKPIRRMMCVLRASRWWCLREGDSRAYMDPYAISLFIHTHKRRTHSAVCFVAIFRFNLMVFVSIFYDLNVCGSR